MNKINFILVFLLLISSCEYEYRTIIPQGTKNTEEQAKVQKTPEEVLKKKLNDSQKKDLDFLKDALGNDALFNKFLSLDESKIKSALEHIHTELEKCNGNNDGKNTFKQVVQGYFNTMDDNKLDQFKTNATSACAVAGG
ncbi:lipoprotein (plasmid) [Candidatus Borrelia fainii]|uniref:Lipoprotein n=1 Tax=Candidatus Borrelia fainii TaxID=2518322 RepID=A0ABM8DLJ4_9SPIR|nr:Mlp family lipoprotein [Candidatus Borrelia fainii]BDU63464.1 lipoprotein [Candidatus Borrelia fainii]